MAPYTPNIPLATDEIPNSQPLILGNFQDIATALAVNHVGFNVGNQGKHAFVTFPVQAAPPAPLANEIDLFSRQSPFSLQPELTFIRNGGVAQEISTSLAANTGWCFTSSGMLLKWGQLTALAADYPVGTAFLLPVAATIPTFSNCFMVYITTVAAGGVDTNTAATLKVYNAAGFTVAGSNRTAPLAGANAVFNYLAIGIQ